MAQPVKYTFDTPFEGPRQGARRPRTTFDLAELEAARTAAYDDGMKAGVALERAAIQKREAEALTVIGAALRDIAAARADAHGAAVRDGARFAAMAARRFAGGLIARDPAFEVEALLRRCLEALHGEPRVVLRVGTDAFDVLGPRIDALAGDIGFDGRVVLVGDPAFEGGACRVEWADGGAERNDDEAWAALDAAIDRATAAPEGPDAMAESATLVPRETT